MNRILLLQALLFFVLSAGQQTPLVAKEVHQRAMIRVGVYDNCPKICLHETGKPQGIFIDIIESIANSQQWDIEFVPGTWKQLVSMLELGAIDVLPDMAFSAGRDSLFSLTTLPVLESWLSIFRTADTDVHSVRDLEGKTVGVLTGSIQETYLETDVKDLFGIDFSLTGYVDYTSKVAALKRGETDAIVADRFFYFSDLFDEDILPTGVVLRPTQLHFAFPADIHPDVVSLFDGHISYLKNTSNSDYYKSLDRWLDREHVFGIPLYLKWVLALISIGLALVVIFTVVLKQRVNARTMELERINRELTKAKDKAEENNRLKSAFLANISHEIRTPMNAILGFLELLKQPDLSDELQRKHIDIIGKSSQRLHDTIGDIVAISVIESAQMVVRREKVCIRDVMDYCYSLFKPHADEKHLALKRTSLIPGDQQCIQTDRNKLEGALINLLKNAIGFTAEGTVEFGNYLEGNSLVFFVKDTGAGIPAGRQEAIFERFVQANVELTRGHEGSGLGLSIAKAYIEALGGTIWVESDVGKGSTFFFSIPFSL